MVNKTEKIKKKLENLLEPKLYQHSIGTADEARSLASHWRLDGSKAYLAGLLHDNAKRRFPEEFLPLALVNGLEVDAWVMNHPKILHGPLAAALLQEEWAINDKEIKEAISCHTLAKAEMSDLAKVVYLADKIEPNRKDFEGLARLRELAYTNLNAAMIAALELSIDYVASRGEDVHPSTEEIKEVYRNKIAKDKKEVII